MGPEIIDSQSDRGKILGVPFYRCRTQGPERARAITRAPAEPASIPGLKSSGHGSFLPPTASFLSKGSPRLSGLCVPTDSGKSSAAWAFRSLLTALVLLF